ncbi:TetR/AcrR family transcriptional regulator [Nocardia callitridis]|uniref:TetR/AcrR family transcriptional regulator n=1 Tax=Nocardia callitridis TaxID=648753 RepID=A0ABP9K6K9_9NOCA
MTPQQRRDELLDTGEQLFGEHPFDEVAMEDIAARAHVSRALMYHYFPTKGEFFAAIWKRAHDRLMGTVRMVATESVRAAVATGLGAHLDFYRAHAALVFIANRSTIATDPAVRGPIAEDMTALCDRILDACDASGHARELAAAALAGWVAFVREVALEWVLYERISREETMELAMAVLDATVGSRVDLAAAPARSG